MKQIDFDVKKLRYLVCAGSGCMLITMDFSIKIEKMFQFWDLGKYCETAADRLLWLMFEGQRVVVHPIQLISRLRIEAEYVED